MKNVQQQAAKEFSQKWEGKGYEKGESQTFWLELLQKVLGVEDPYSVISFENQVKLSNTSFIDAYIEPTHVLIEQKSIEKDLRKAIPQSDGSFLTPFQQAKRYSDELPYSKRARWVVICNFRQFHVYDMENPHSEPEVIELKDLEKDYYRLQFLVDTGNEHLKKEMEVSLKAGEIIGEIYDELLKQYINPDDPESLKSLNILCVRLVFCFYAEDAGIFGEKRCMFHDYLAQFKPGDGDMRDGLIKLFEVLNTPPDKRSPYLKPSLKAFPYCNGGLFADTDIEIPFFNDKLATLILKHASDDFDWSQISPTIFGAVFESTLNPETRRSGGMHYTSIENIHKVIDPLFLDELTEEYEAIKDDPIEKSRVSKAKSFQDKLASLKFLDPACGSGNFLTETYLSLRRLENKAMFLIGDIFNPIKVDIHQFYGIEINDFAVATATTALWIAEAQMMAETEKVMHTNLDFLPLKSYHNIVEGNALRMDWSRLRTGEEADVVYADRLNVIRPEELEEQKHILRDPSNIHYGELNVVTKDVHFGPPDNQSEPLHFDYIIGNPPFVGARWMSKEQKEDVLEIFGKKWNGVGDLDYVCCWYKKAADFIRGTSTQCALVSTNSITQGGSVANLWKPLFEQCGIHIDFAWRTFRWDSESNLKAHVHCVIVGFSWAESDKTKRIFEEGKSPVEAKNINGYLLDAPDVFVGSRNRPLCDVPLLLTGSQRIDDDNYIFTAQEKEEFIKNEPESEKFFRIWYGADEFINNRPRWCLYLGNCSPAELKSMPKCYELVEKVRKYRMSSKREQTVKASFSPTHFGLEVIPNGNFMIVPVVSSERRRYIPLGFMSRDKLCSNQVNLIPDATLYHFGILTSNVHMAWMRAVCGRLEMRYRYSKDIVYNNFPWPKPTDEQKAKIEQTAQAILDARAKYPDCSLADLYDEVSMPPDLRKAHQENDRAVMEAYGFNWHSMTESECVAELFKMYQKLTEA